MSPKPVLALLLLPAGCWTAEPDLARIARQAGGVVGVCAIHVETGHRIALNDTVRFPMASVCKLPLAIVTFQRVEQGAENLARKVRLEPGDMRTGPLAAGARLGTFYAIRQLLEASLEESDNTAADILFRIAGGPKGVETRIRELGIGDIDVSRTELLLSADYAGVKLPSGEFTLSSLRKLYAAVPAAEARRARQRFDADPRDTATPAALAALLVKVHEGGALKAETTAMLLAMMRACKTGGNRIRALLPPGTPVADKTGTIGGTVNDVGIVTLPGKAGHVAIAVLVKQSKQPAEAERAIATIARTLYAHFLSP